MDAKMTGEIIARKRKEMGLNQTQLAELLNVSNRTISKWENGDGFPDITLLPEISKVLDISIDYLLTGEEKTKSKSENLLSKNTVNIFNMFFVVSVFLAVFSAILGGITEIYSIWAFPVLFYTHWEIIFVAVSLFTTALSGMVFLVSVVRLHIEYSKKEIIAMAGKKGIILLGVLSVFPLTFIARIFDYSRWGYFMPYVMIILTVVLVALLVKLNKKLGESV